MLKKDKLREDMNKLIYADLCIEGNENLITDILSKISSNSIDGAKWVGGKLADKFVEAFKSANNSIIQSLGSHKTKISQLSLLLSKEKFKEEIDFTKAFLSKVTSSGEVDDIIKDCDYLIKILSSIDNYRLELEKYYHKELELFKQYDNIKTTEQAVKVLQNLDDLVFPELKLTTSHDGVNETNQLPNGKVFIFKKENNTFSIENSTVDATDIKTHFSDGDLKTLISKMNTLSSCYKDVVKGNENYIEYIKQFNIVVGKAFGHIESLKGTISISLMRDLESKLEGNKNTFSFYSGFLPKVTIYLDDYLDVLSSFFSKQFN